jgi:hypothetical protein
MVTRDGADGENPDEEAGDVVGKRGFTKKTPGTIEQIAPNFSSGVLAQLVIPLRR